MDKLFKKWIRLLPRLTSPINELLIDNLGSCCIIMTCIYHVSENQYRNAFFLFKRLSAQVRQEYCLGFFIHCKIIRALEREDRDADEFLLSVFLFILHCKAKLNFCMRNMSTNRSLSVHVQRKPLVWRILIRSTMEPSVQDSLGRRELIGYGHIITVIWLSKTIIKGQRGKLP